MLRPFVIRQRDPVNLATIILNPNAYRVVCLNNLAIRVLLWMCKWSVKISLNTDVHCSVSTFGLGWLADKKESIDEYLTPQSTDMAARPSRQGAPHIRQDTQTQPPP